MTLDRADHVPDDAYQLARHQFTEKELVDLTLAIAAINAWNRLAVTFRPELRTFPLAQPKDGKEFQDGAHAHV